MVVVDAALANSAHFHAPVNERLIANRVELLVVDVDRMQSYGRITKIILLRKTHRELARIKSGADVHHKHTRLTSARENRITICAKTLKIAMRVRIKEHVIRRLLRDSRILPSIKLLRSCLDLLINTLLDKVAL